MCHGSLHNVSQIAIPTALGSSAVAESWRESKANGGVLIDVQTGETIVSGLSMPHSPRMAHGRLWLLESGRGSLGDVDVEQGVYHPVVELPGFTRGLDFCQHYAFVGLSQVRESAILSGIEVTQRLSAGQRKCGIGVIDLRTGQLAAFLNFEQAVQEMFAVSVLPHRFPELINDNLETIGNTYVLPDDCVSDVPEQYR